MGEEENDFFEKYSPLPEVLETRGGKGGNSSDLILYLGAGIVALLAIIAFVHYSFAPASGGAIPGIAVPANTDSFVLSYAILSTNGTQLTNGTAQLTDIKDLRKETSLILSERVYELISKLQKGEDATIALSIAEALGEINRSNVGTVNRTETIQRRVEVKRIVTVSTSDFTNEFGKKPEINKTYLLQGAAGNYTVVSIDGDYVNVRWGAEVGQIAPIDNIFFMSVAEVNENTVVTMRNAEPQILQLPNGNLTIAVGPELITLTLTPQIGQKITLGNNPPARVLKYDNEKIYLDYNYDYVGKSLVLKVKMLDRKN